MNHYRTISSSRVPAEVRIPSLEMLFMCREHMGVEMDYVWIAPCGEREADLSRRSDIAGLYTAKTNTVCLRGDVGLERMLGVVAHEVRHAWQIRNFGRARRADLPVVEMDAERYAAAAMRQFVGGFSPEWEWLAKRQSFPLFERYESDQEQVEEHVLTRLSQLNLLFK